MPTLVDMKRTDADKERQRKEWDKPDVSTMDDYGYGLTLHLDHEACEKLGITDGQFDAGNSVMLAGEAMITSETVNTVNGETRRSLSLQIQKLGLSQEKAARDLAAEMYGSRK